MIDLLNNETARKTAWEQRGLLMQEALDTIIAGKPEAVCFYNELAHRHLMKHAWEIMHPEPKENWPQVFVELEYDDQMTWPQATTYSYVMNSLFPPNIGWLHLYFGYVVVNGKLIRTTFFGHNKMVEYQIAPQGIAIDPLALQKGIEPDYYIGCPVCSKDYLEDFIKRLIKNPFEEYVLKDGHNMM